MIIAIVRSTISAAGNAGVSTALTPKQRPTQARRPQSGDTAEELYERERFWRQTYVRFRRRQAAQRGGDGRRHAAARTAAACVDLYFRHEQRPRPFLGRAVTAPEAIFALKLSIVTSFWATVFNVIFGLVRGLRALEIQLLGPQRDDRDHFPADGDPDGGRGICTAAFVGPYGRSAAFWNRTAYR